MYLLHQQPRFAAVEAVYQKALTEIRNGDAADATMAQYKPGSPEHADALREYWSARAIERLKEILAKSPPFTQAQRDRIIAALCRGEVAPESTPAP